MSTTPVPTSTKPNRLVEVPRRRRVLPLPVAPLLTAVIVAVGLTVLVPALPSHRLTVRVDMYASGGTSVALYLNDVSHPPQVQPLVPGVGKTYTFDGPDGDIRRIRVDVADHAGVRVRLFGISVNDGSRVITDFRRNDLVGWARYFVSEPTTDPDALDVTSTAPGANVDAFRTVVAPSKLGWPVGPLAEAVKNPQHRLRNGLVGITLGLCFLALATRRGRWALGVSAIAGGIGILAIDLILDHPSGLASASTAVGRATYLGSSLPTNLRAIRLLYLSTLIIAVGAALWFRRLRGHSESQKEALRNHEATRPTGLLTAAIWVGVVLVMLGTFFPDLRQAVRAATTGQQPAGWDSENLVSWNAFSARGLVPTRDFWYPYGNSDIFQRSVVGGTALFAVYQFVLALAYWWVFWVASRRRLVASSLAAIGLVFAQPIIGEFPRYGLSVAIALSYSCIDPDAEPRRRLLGRMIFGLLTGLGIFLEPILVAYAAVGVLAALALDAISGWRRGLRWWLLRLGGDLALPAVAFLAWVALTTSRGQLRGMLDLYSTLGATATFSAQPTILMAGVRSALDLSVLVVWVPAVLLAVGVFGRLSRRTDRLGYDLPSRLAILGAVAAPLLLKHALRPLPTQLLVFPLVATALLLLWASEGARFGRLVGALVGVAAAVVIGFHGPGKALDGIRDLPGRVSGNADLVISDRGDIRRADRLRFAPRSFASYPQELAVMADLRPRLDPHTKTNFYVLGDAPVLYVLLSQRPPWQINVYNTSLLKDQRRTVAWLKQHAPPFVIFDRGTLEFDNVPHAVRIPLVFEAVIENYSFDHSVGPFDILRRRAPGTSVPERYWASALSTSIDFGDLPDVSSYRRVRPCTRAGKKCGRFLVLRAPTKNWAGTVEVPLRFDQETLTARFNALGKRRLYAVPLARTWPWALSHRPAIAGAPTAGWQAQIVSGEQPRGVLY
jgi:hypothetical protein